MATHTPQLTEIATIPRTERLRTGHVFQEMSGTQMSALLADAEKGYTELYAMWCEHALRTDLNLAADFNTRKDRVARSDWTIQPATEDDAGKRVADDVTLALKGMHGFRKTLKEMVHGVLPGWAVHEIIWRAGDFVRPEELRWKHPRRFRFDENYGIRLFDGGIHSRGGSIYGRTLEEKKFIVHQPSGLGGHVTQSGLGHALAYFWLFKLWVEKFYVHYLEKHGQPLVYQRIPESTTEHTANQILQDLQRLSYDSVGFVRGDGEIVVEAAAIAASKGEAHRDYLERATEMQTKLLLGTSDATSPGEHGSRAAVEARTASTTDAIMQMDGWEIAETLQRDLIYPILYFNRHRYGGQVPEVPSFKWSWDLEATQYAPEIIATGAIPLNRVLESQGLDPFDDDRYDRPMLEMQGGGAATPDRDRPATPPGIAATPGEDVQRTALNGAQVDSLREIVASVARGEIPRETGVEMIVASFPIERPQAEAIMGSIGKGFEPAPDPEAEPVGGQDAAPPFAMSRGRNQRPPSSRKTTSATATPAPSPLLMEIGTALSQASAGRVILSRQPSSQPSKSSNRSGSNSRKPFSKRSPSARRTRGSTP